VLSDTEACEGLRAGAACIAGKKKFVTKPEFLFSLDFCSTLCQDKVEKGILSDL